MIAVLSRLVSARGAPAFLRSDNGPAFVLRAMLRWIVEQGIETALIEPGKPWQNGVVESFNGKFRGGRVSPSLQFDGRPSKFSVADDVVVRGRSDGDGLLSEPVKEQASCF